jgi:nucleotide-binding universal stress UspA family protein
MRVLIAHDGSECADAAVVNLRRAGIPSDAEVLLISVVDIGASKSMGPELQPGVANQPSKSDLREAKAATHDAFRWIELNFPGWRATREFLWGPPAAVILEKAHSWRPDLIVVGSHGRSLPGRVLLGSVSLKVAHEAPCSVRVVRPGAGSKGPIRIVAGIDGSIQARAVIDELSRRVWPKETEVRIVSVVESVVPVVGTLQPVVGSEDTLLALQDSIQRQRDRFQETAVETHGRLERTGLIVSESVVEGNPPHELLAEAKRWNADTIFAGARGMGRLEELLLGSVSTSILKHAPCAVEIVRRAC